MRGLLAALLLAVATQAAAQTQPSPPARQPTGRVSFTFDTWQRNDTDAARSSSVELATAINVQTPDVDARGVEYALNLRHAGRTGSDRQRFSLYDGWAGVRFGENGQVGVRAGHMWLPDLGTVGALAGGLVEYRQPRSDVSKTRVRVGGFAGREPLVYQMGYAQDVSKTGGYVAVEQGYLRRHVLGYTRIRQGQLTERSLLTVTNFVPAGRAVFLYQAAEVDVSGPANGAAKRGLSYFLSNLRVTPAQRVELFGTYNRGRSVDARTLTDDLRNGRSLTQQSLDGLLYESAGARVTVEVVRNIRVYAGYSRDRNNREDVATGRMTLGGHAGNLFGTGLDVSASNARIDRPQGAYNSRYVSVGRALGRTLYVSGDYATSLSLVRFFRSDGVVIETHPWSRRLSGNASVAIGRRWSLMLTGDYEKDDLSTQFRLLTGLSVRIR